MFPLRASESRLISSMKLDGGKDIHAVKSVCSVLHSELKDRALPLLKENNLGYKTNLHTYCPAYNMKDYLFGHHEKY